MTQYLSVGSVAFTCVSQIFLVGLCSDDLLAVKVEAAERIAISALLLQYVEELIEVSLVYNVDLLWVALALHVIQKRRDHLLSTL